MQTNALTALSALMDCVVDGVEIVRNAVQDLQLSLRLKRPDFCPAGGTVVVIGLLVQRAFEPLRGGIKRLDGIIKLVLCCVLHTC